MIISIKPHWANAIARCDKTIELRRRRPHVVPGLPFIVYSTLPEGRLVALGRISEVIAGSPDELWNATQGQVLIEQDEFAAYFAGSSTGYGLRLTDSIQLDEQPTLQELRDRVGFIAPQSWRFVTAAQCLSMFSTDEGSKQVSDFLSAAPR